jgi:hypothetical protein
MKFIKIIIVFLLLISCNNKEEYLVRSFKTNNGWGYEIAINNKIVIKQTVIPTIPNQVSFKSESDALKVGNLVLERIKQNISPTVAKKDLILLEISI